MKGGEAEETGVWGRKGEEGEQSQGREGRGEGERKQKGLMYGMKERNGNERERKEGEYRRKGWSRKECSAPSRIYTSTHFYLLSFLFLHPLRQVVESSRLLQCINERKESLEDITGRHLISLLKSLHFHQLYFLLAFLFFHPLRQVIQRVSLSMHCEERALIHLACGISSPLPFTPHMETSFPVLPIILRILMTSVHYLNVVIRALLKVRLNIRPKKTSP